MTGAAVQLLANDNDEGDQQATAVAIKGHEFTGHKSTLNDGEKIADSLQ